MWLYYGDQPMRITVYKNIANGNFMQQSIFPTCKWVCKLREVYIFQYINRNCQAQTLDQIIIHSKNLIVLKHARPNIVIN